MTTRTGREIEVPAASTCGQCGWRVTALTIGAALDQHEAHARANHPGAERVGAVWVRPTGEPYVAYRELDPFAPTTERRMCPKRPGWVFPCAVPGCDCVDEVDPLDEEV